MNTLIKRIVTLFMAFCILAGLLPEITLPANAADSADSGFAGKTISILGDSISTYTGVSNNTAYNSTIGSNAVYYSGSNLGVSQADTWWQQAIDALGMELLVNNSWSGSCVLHTRSNTVGAYVDRCVQLHNTAGEEPDVIAVFMGTNDFSYYQSALGTADIDYDTLIADNGDGTFTYATPATSCEAYAIMLHKMTKRYPNADIYCMTLTARRDPDKEDNYADVGQPTAFNAELSKIIEYFGCTVVDLENCGIDKAAATFDQYMGDGRVHPNAEGMDLITRALVSSLMGAETDVYDVSAELTNVTMEGKSTVLSGDGYTASLTETGGFSGMSVTITMGGEDITVTCYADGKISIGSVTGDVVITAAALERNSKNFRWEFDGTDLVSMSSGSNEENNLTKLAGSTTDGVLSNTAYEIENSVILRHDRPWVMEFRAFGSWSGMIFSQEKSASTAGNTYLFKTTSDSGFIGFGERNGNQYHNYGIALGAQGVDTTAEHTYRLENRFESDGSNMVYLLVDGVNYGAMNHYFIGGTSDQGTTVNWLSGKDLVFSHIGASGHAMNGCAIDYIQAWEAGVPEDKWEQGTIASATGLNRADTTRLRTMDYLCLSDYGGVGINPGYTMTNFVYDENMVYLGTSSWLGSGVSFTTAELQEKYPTGKYFRIALRTLNSATVTVDDIAATGVTFYAPDEEIPVPESDVKYEDIMTIGTWQDGAIYDGKLFVLGGSGTGAVYDLATQEKLGSLTLDNKDVLKPHANSVCFGSTYFAEGDQYPLLYVNIYNNYSSAEDRMEGTCCVYRVTETDGQFATELVQVIEIGFTEDLTLWKSKESNGDVRPYGNFVVDTDNDKLYAFVMRDAENITRFFRFDLPALTLGTYNETYGCNVATLESTDIEAQFDTEYFNYLQGCCYYDGMIISAEGFSSGGSAEPALRIVDLDAQQLVKTYYPAEAGLTNEPEVVCADTLNGTLYYAAADGVLRKLTLDGTHFHTYESVVTPPTCTKQGCTTYTCTDCGDCYMDNYVDEKGHAYENGTCTICGVADWDTDGDGILEILAIGNSFSIDALEYAYQIAYDLGIDEIVIGNLYISGCTLKTHAANAADDIANYTYYFNDSGSWSTTSNYKISTALTDRSWDYVSMQQSSKYSGVESTYNEDLTSLIAYVQDRSDAKLVWHMTWAYQQDSTHTAFPIYDSDQMTMYNAIVSAVQNKIATNSAFDLIVPNGTAVQNSRTSLLGDITTRDGYHMSRDYGQYMTGLLFIKTVTGLSVDGITYAPSGVDAQEMVIAIESVNNAYANPFAVTESVYTGEAPEEGYVLLRSELFKGAFWSPVTEERYNDLFYDRSMSHKYFATIRFTKETLPVGSIIILADGWQYRPDGWITDTVQTGTREPTTRASYVVVTENWWGNYTIRAFNISKVGLPSLTDVSEEEVRAAFQIYVPEARHSHAFENGVCTLCGEHLRGDLDLDGDVDSDDLTLLARHVGGIEPVTNPTALYNADVNADGTIDSDDLTKHARFVGGIITDWDQK